MFDLTRIKNNELWLVERTNSFKWQVTKLNISIRVLCVRSLHTLQKSQVERCPITENIIIIRSSVYHDNFQDFRLLFE